MIAILATIPSLIGVAVCVGLLAKLNEPQARQRLGRRLVFGRKIKAKPATNIWPLRKRISVAWKILSGTL